MNDQRKYVLDANVFIQAKNSYYRFDVFPAFWRTLLELHDQGTICSVDKIKEELQATDDELKDWVENETTQSFFASTDTEDVINTYSMMMEWVNDHDQFWESAKADFADSADGWLVDYAHVHDMLVVTHEVFAPNIEKKIKIPNLCHEFDIEPVNTFEMLSQLGIKFS